MIYVTNENTEAKRKELNNSLRKHSRKLRKAVLSTRHSFINSTNICGYLLCARYLFS